MVVVSVECVILVANPGIVPVEVEESLVEVAHHYLLGASFFCILGLVMTVAKLLK